MSEDRAGARAATPAPARAAPTERRPASESIPRVLGRYDAGRPGPLFLIVAGLHGNEPAGVAAARALCAALEERRPPFAGRLVALSGNRAALARGVRYVQRDLNRVWTDAELCALRERAPTADDVEGREQRELLAALEAELRPGEELRCLDLHSTSAHGAPFSLAADSLQNRALTEALPLPMLLGLEERIDGPLLSWLADRGHAAVVVEGGQHDHPATPARLEAAAWLFLVEGGALAPDADPAIARARAELELACRDLPHVVEILVAHPIVPEDDFCMRPGFANFHPVHAGDPLADDRRGALPAPRDGLLLMPLYQGLGTDGFFIGREVPPSWLRFSRACRASGMESLLASLPGVRVPPGRPRTFAVRRDAPPVVWRVLRHFGYRKKAAATAEELCLGRRPERGEPA